MNLDEIEAKISEKRLYSTKEWWPVDLPTIWSLIQEARLARDLEDFIRDDIELHTSCGACEENMRMRTRFLERIDRMRGDV